MLVQPGVTPCPKVEKQSAGPGEYEVAVMNGDRLVNIAAAPLGIAPAIALTKLTNLQNRETGIVANGSESLHSKPVLITGDVK